MERMCDLRIGFAWSEAGQEWARDKDMWRDLY